MTSLTMTKTIDIPGGMRNISVDISKEGCNISMSTSDQSFNVVAGTWEEINNPEWMYESFKFEYLVAFKGLADMLDKIITNKHIYMELL